MPTWHCHSLEQAQAHSSYRQRRRQDRARVMLRYDVLTERQRCRNRSSLYYQKHPYSSLSQMGWKPFPCHAFMQSLKLLLFVARSVVCRSWGSVSCSPDNCATRCTHYALVKIWACEKRSFPAGEYVCSDIYFDELHGRWWMYLSLLCDGSFDSLCCDDQVANSEALSQELHFLQGTLQLDPASRRKLTRMQAVTKTVWGGYSCWFHWGSALLTWPVWLAGVQIRGSCNQDLSGRLHLH